MKHQSITTRILPLTLHAGPGVCGFIAGDCMRLGEHAIAAVALVIAGLFTWAAYARAKRLEADVADLEDAATPTAVKDPVLTFRSLAPQRPRLELVPPPRERMRSDVAWGDGRRLVPRIPLPVVDNEATETFTDPVSVA